MSDRADRTENGPHGGPQPVHHVGACLDRSALEDRIMPHAVAMARAFRARLTVVHALEPPHEGPEATVTDPLDWEVQRAEGRRHLEMVQSEHEADDLQVDNELLEGRPAEEIRDWVVGNDVDLTVFASHGVGGWTGWGLASTARKLVDRISGSVLVVPAGSAHVPVGGQVTYDHLLVLLDGSLRAESVLPLASRIARAHGSELLLLHVVPTPEPGCPGAVHQAEYDLDRRIVDRNVRAAEVYLGGIAGRLEDQGARVRTVVATGVDVRGEILRRISDDHIDLLLLSGHGHGGRLELPLGSIANFLVEHSPTPLLVMRRPTTSVAWPEPTSRDRGGIRLPQPTEP